MKIKKSSKNKSTIFIKSKFIKKSPLEKSPAEITVACSSNGTAGG